MSTIIHFIGLVTLVTTTSLTPAPPHILIPRFTDVVPAENRIIRIPSSAVDRANTTWPFTTVGTNDEFPIETRNFSITGAGNFTNGVVAMPHLTCCCEAMKDGIREDYENPDTPPSEKKAAYVFLDNGQLFEFEESNKALHYDLVVTPIDGKIEIVSGKDKPQQQKIVVNVGVEPLDIAIMNQPSDDIHFGHWFSYYRMAKVPAICPETPKNDPTTCGPKPNGCLNTGSAKKTAKKKVKDILRKSKLHGTMMTTDINCSNSQWP